MLSDPGPTPASARLRLCGRRPLARPRHHLAKPGADLLDRVGGGPAAKCTELRPARRLLREEVAREPPLLDLPELAAHVLAHVLVDDPRPHREIAVLGCVGDG